MAKEVKKDPRQLIRDPVSIQRHLRVKEDFEKKLRAIQAKYKDYLSTQKPKTEALIEIVVAEIAFTYSLRKKTTYKIIKDYFQYEEADPKA